MTIKTFQIIGRMKPSEKDPEPKVYRMKLFARDDVCARSKFWYFIRCARALRRAALRIESGGWHEALDEPGQALSSQRQGCATALCEGRTCALCARGAAVLLRPASLSGLLRGWPGAGSTGCRGVARTSPPARLDRGGKPDARLVC